MSIPYDNIKQAITDAGKPEEHRRPKTLPNYFECLCPEDYADDRPPNLNNDPAAGTKDRDTEKDLPGANKKGGG